MLGRSLLEGGRLLREVDGVGEMVGDDDDDLEEVGGEGEGEGQEEGLGWGMVG